MDKPQKHTEILFDILEKWVPIVCFFTMFILFLSQIFSRYLLNRPLFGADELINITYIWAVIISASYVQRKKKHIAFPLVYDKLDKGGKAIFRILGNLIVISALLACLYTSFDYLYYLRRDTTAVLRIPVNGLYLSILLTFLLICVHMTQEIIESIRDLSKKGESHVK